MAWLTLIPFFPFVVAAAETATGSSPTSIQPAVPPAGNPGGKGMELDRDYLKGYVRDTGKILSSPVRWEGKDWLTASLVVAATAGFYAYDQDIKEWSG